jgi:hypothetical protein
MLRSTTTYPSCNYDIKYHGLHEYATQHSTHSTCQRPTASKSQLHEDKQSGNQLERLPAQEPTQSALLGGGPFQLPLSNGGPTIADQELDQSERQMLDEGALYECLMMTVKGQEARGGGRMRKRTLSAQPCMLASVVLCCGVRGSP